MAETLIITKSAVGQHALDGAGEMLSYDNSGIHSRDPISAHILACSAAEILKELSIQHTDTSVYGIFRDVAHSLGSDRKIITNKLNLALNFFKHANKDWGKQLDFDPTLTHHIFYLAFLDLGKLVKIQPDAPNYVIKPSEHTDRVARFYKALYSSDNLSLANLDQLLKDDNEKNQAVVKEHIRNWFINRTNLLGLPNA
ncbi:hypothetical protein SAMN02744133_10310 [Thalassospira xiamenensis M-5 = DSM 17429]|uniref:Uncharacterized protein n=1 Tax=Thalassospira xiamenensis M-5 = DSM 17429 TaxID=1123366 RepID=A0AB72UDN6_9PROT|nr:hypothetical protein [Thalassospira xiamenensis]AJD52381.1 hypothetical protein TH3_11325 [Thalassospira xiamenensis M-5 = DSM 17429]SIS85944.1 hypothetical protein SAMN02744133_10310 [Thalassospira xiamenensis M-5 = DSM 17429]